MEFLVTILFHQRPEVGRGRRSFWLLVSGFCILLGLGCQPRKEEARSPVLARVGGAVLTIEGLGACIPDDLVGSLSLDDKKRMVERWVEEQLLYQEAQRRGIDREDQIERLIESSKVDLVVSELLQRLNDDHSPTNDELLQYYNEHQDEFVREDDEVWARHILVATRAEARRIRARILAGEPFEQVLEEQSQDPATIDSGDLGYFSRKNAGDDLWNAVTKLRVGILSRPVKTEFGYHIIELLDTKGQGSLRAFEKVKADIVGKRSLIKQQEKVQSLLKSLTTQTVCEVHLKPLEETHSSPTED
jgi:peptidyl-prolyl cis-trans isomerase C